MLLNSSIIFALISLNRFVFGESHWTKDETVIICKKVWALFDEPRMKILNQMKKKGFEKENYTKGTNIPSAAKVSLHISKIKSLLMSFN